MIGLFLYGFSMAMLIEADLGLDPWDVLHQGLTRYVPLSFGTVTILVSAVVLLLWIPLRQKPGLGTICNVFVVGLSADFALWLLPTPDQWVVRIPLMIIAVVLNGVAGAIDIGSQLGPGARDGLMTGLVRRTGGSLRLIRTGIEAVVLVVGFLLGGTVGVGTVLYAITIGPLVQFFLPWFGVPLDSGAAGPVDDRGSTRSDEGCAQQVKSSRGYQVLVGVGLVSYGIVHLVVAWIAIQIALGGRGDASSSGALRELASQPFGFALMIIMAIGLFTLVLWQGFEAAIGGRGADDKERLRRRVRSAGRALVYLALGVTAAALAIGASGGSGNAEETVTARLLALPFGRILVVALGAAVAGVGIAQIVKGVRKKFTEDLRSGVSRPVQVLGTVGYVAKGIALVIIGLLFGWAAWSANPQRAGGLDAALSTVRGQPFGSVLLLAMAAGFACFGLFCFVWAKNARH